MYNQLIQTKNAEYSNV